MTENPYRGYNIQGSTEFHRSLAWNEGYQAGCKDESDEKYQQALKDVAEWLEKHPSYFLSNLNAGSNWDVLIGNLSEGKLPEGM